MAGRPSTKECKVCHHRFPVTQMVSSEGYVHTGKSGWSLSFDLSKTKNKRHRAHTGRRYYSKKTVWVCNNCNKEIKAVNRKTNILSWSIIIGVVFMIVVPVLL